MNENLNCPKGLLTKATCPTQIQTTKFSPLSDVSTLSSNPQSTVLQRKDDTHQIPPFGVDQDILSYSVQELDSPTFNNLQGKVKEIFENFSQQHQGKHTLQQLEDFLVDLEAVEQQYVPPGYYETLYQNAKEFEDQQSTLIHAPKEEEKS